MLPKGVKLSRVIDQEENDIIKIVRNTSELSEFCNEKIPKVILSFEGVYPFEGDISRFNEFYNAGLRQLQLYRQSNPRTIRSYNSILL